VRRECWVALRSFVAAAPRPEPVNPKNAGRLEKINLNLEGEESSMQSRTSALFAFTLGSATIFGTAALAADLPQSGTIKIHSDSKVNVQVTEVGDKHIMASANSSGVTHNDSGSGPLHMGAWFCAFSFENVNGPPNYSGSCAFGDAGGADKILITFTGKGSDSGATKALAQSSVASESMLASTAKWCGSATLLTQLRDSLPARSNSTIG
jgi:hypothetical protein